MSIRPTAVTNDSAHHAHDAHPLGSPAYHEQRLKEVLAAGHAHNEATTGAPAKSSVQKLMSGGFVSGTFKVVDYSDRYEVSTRRLTAMQFTVTELNKKSDSTEGKFDPRGLSAEAKRKEQQEYEQMRDSFAETNPYLLEKKNGDLVMSVTFKFMDPHTKTTENQGFASSIIVSANSELGPVKFVTDGAYMSGIDQDTIRHKFNALRQHIQRMTGMMWSRKSRYNYYYDRIFDMNN